MAALFNLCRADACYRTVFPMVITKLTRVLFIIVALVGGSCQALQLNAQQAIVISNETGSVLFEKNANSQVPIASLTKLMTAMTVLDSQPDMNEKIEITDQDVDAIKHSRSHVPVGTLLERRQVLQLALMSSDNRAAAALARTYPGGNAGFARAVREKIKGLDMSHTVIGEPTGLSPENTSTAADLAKMARAASHYPEIVRITTGSSAPIKLNRRSVIFHNTNHLVGAKGWDILLSKTGFTNEAGHCLIMRVKQAGKDATLVLLNSKGGASSRLDALNIRRFLSDPREEKSRVATMHKGTHRTAS
jgi:D-alanyl-D-alanine carboxypeptidase/D-alanyl-D-alanine endopeptidase (penicillin-binding protein 7)